MLFDIIPQPTGVLLFSSLFSSDIILSRFYCYVLKFIDHVFCRVRLLNSIKCIFHLRYLLFHVCKIHLGLISSILFLTILILFKQWSIFIITVSTSCVLMLLSVSLLGLFLLVFLLVMYHIFLFRYTW